MSKRRSTPLAAACLFLLSILLVQPQPLLAATVLGAYATVRTPLLNVRTGPSTDFPILDTVRAGETIAVIGRLADCSWLQVVRPGKGAGWVTTELVQLSQSCRDLPNAAPPALTSQLAATAKRADPAPAAIALAQPAEQAAGEPTPAATGCTGIPGESYSALSVASAPTDRPAASHPDFNLALRGYQPATASAALLDLYPAGDWLAPQLTGLLGDHRQPAINSAFQVFDWNWDCNCRGDLLSEPAVSLLGLRVSAGEAIYTPDSPRSLGDGYEALVLFATADALTLKFTREDNVVHGYTLHLLGLCVEPQLLALYTTLDSAGRATLPALRGGQPFGRARSDTLLVGIRDNGQFLEPRSLENWWR